jgi:pyridoxine 5-phosphate synthase
MKHMRLGINIDHVATIRNARRGTHPDPLRAAMLAMEAGANGITIHLREDRRHIQDADVFTLRERSILPINLEMAATDAMLDIALQIRPHAVCLVPERREEITTEGGIDAAGRMSDLRDVVARLSGAGIQVSLFIDPDVRQVRAAAELGAQAVELHTGSYAEASGDHGELQRLQMAAAATERLKLECHAGHGLNYDNVIPVAAIPQVVELNIGHFLVGEALFVGFVPAIERMCALIQEVRSFAPRSQSR